MIENECLLPYSGYQFLYFWKLLSYKKIATETMIVLVRLAQYTSS